MIETVVAVLLLALILYVLLEGLDILPDPKSGTAKRRGSAGMPSDPKIVALREKVLRLLNGDAKVAARLFVKIRDRYPHKTEQWIWEKVIWDLERDRH